MITKDFSDWEDELGRLLGHSPSEATGGTNSEVGALLTSLRAAGGSVALGEAKSKSE